jgi:NodT family efflux transporter outer membrane factor (OMF) lipoprotein
MMRKLLGLGVSALLFGCTLGPDFTPPKAPTEQGYTATGLPDPAIPEAAGPSQHFALGKEISGAWWKLFHSPPLDDVLAQAIAGNRTLAAASASLDQAREAVNQAAGGLYPQVDLGGTAARQRLNYAAQGITLFPPKIFNIFTFGPTISYDLDPFGATRRRIEQQQALAEAQEDQLKAAYLTLTGNAASQALTIASLRAQIKTVEDIIADDQENLRLVREEVNAGIASDLDIDSATSQIETDRTLLPPLNQQLSVARHALAILVGKPPGDWTPPDFDLAALTLPEELPVSVPSALLHQRPDLLQAEAQLHAASAAIGIATAELYPDIRLSASMTQEALSPGKLFYAANDAWSIGSQLTAPIFHGGALEAQRRGAEDAFRAFLASYEQTVLQSFGQVADLLEALAHDAEFLAAQRRALDASQASLSLTRRSYSLGNSTLLQVLDAQRLDEQARLGYVRAEAQRYLDTVQLFVAMGGGWWQSDAGAQPLPAAARSTPSTSP